MKSQSQVVGLNRRYSIKLSRKIFLSSSAPGWCLYRGCWSRLCVLPPGTQWWNCRYTWTMNIYISPPFLWASLIFVFWWSLEWEWWQNLRPSISLGHISASSSCEVAKPRSLLSVTTLVNVDVIVFVADCYCCPGHFQRNTVIISVTTIIVMITGGVALRQWDVV